MCYVLRNITIYNELIKFKKIIINTLDKVVYRVLFG